MSENILLQGEAYLGAWADGVVSSTGATDPWIKLYLSDSDMLDLIRPCESRGRSGKGGKRVAVVLVEIDDNEEIVPQEEPRKKLNGISNLSQCAAMLCKHHKFFDWYFDSYRSELTNLVSDLDPDVWNQMEFEDRNKAIIYHCCNITSRSELDSNKEAAHTFNKFIRIPFSKHCEVYNG